MIDEIRLVVAPFYLWVKAFHVMSAALWGFSTVVAWTCYLKPALRSARRHPDDAGLRATGDAECYERTLDAHWTFFRVTEPVVAVLVPGMFLLAIIKPF